MRKTPENYFIYETSYGNDIPVHQLFLHMFDEIPSLYKMEKTYKSDIKEYLTSNGFTLLTEVNTVNRRRAQKLNTETLLFNDKNKTGVLLKSKYEKDTLLFEIECYYTLINGSFESNFDVQKISEFEVVLKKSGISLVKSEMGHMDTEDYELNVPDVDVELNYGLSEPSIIPFLMEHKNSILIIEDAEKVISDREINGSSAGVSNILNITDGILGDCLNIQIVATFNMKKEKIDKALLRKGRLICEHKFTPLSVENSNKLLKHLGKTKTVDKPTSLADIYHIDEDLARVENKIQIGFKNN